jgi:hypothetical protein
MGNILSYEKFVSILKSDPVPDYNEEVLINSIKNKTNTLQNHKTSKLLFVVVPLIILTTIISSVTFGSSILSKIAKPFEVINTESLKDKNGEKIFKYSKVELDGKYESELSKVKSVYDRYWTVMNKQQSTLKPTEMGIFIAIEAYEINGAYQLLGNKQYFLDIDDLISGTTTKFFTPKLLPKDFTFKNGTIEYCEDENMLQIAEDLYNRAKQEGKEYIFQKIKPSKIASLIEINYKSKINETINFRIDRSTEYNYTDNKSLPEIQIDTIKLRDLDILYLTFKGTSTRKIIFVDDAGTGKLTYNITFPVSTSAYKDMKPYITSMIESMK